MLRPSLLAAVGTLAVFPWGTTQADGATHTVVILGEDFRPVTLTVATGDTVRWTYDGLGGHNVRSTAGVFRSENLTGVGATFSFTFAAPGSYDYLCSIHPSTMRGTIVVEEPASTLTPSLPAPTGPIAPSPTAAGAATVAPTRPPGTPTATVTPFAPPTQTAASTTAPPAAPDTGGEAGTVAPAATTAPSGFVVPPLDAADSQRGAVAGTLQTPTAGSEDPSNEAPNTKEGDHRIVITLFTMSLAAAISAGWVGFRRRRGRRG